MCFHSRNWLDFVTRTFKDNMQRAFQVKTVKGYYTSNTYLEAEPCKRPSQKASLFCKAKIEIESHLNIFKLFTQYADYSIRQFTSYKKQNKLRLKTCPTKTEYLTVKQKSSWAYEASPSWLWKKSL